MKQLLKRSIKSAVSLVGHQNPHATRILTYHSIGERRHEMTVGTADFRRQMQWLKDNARVITLEAAVEGQHGIALTFDDGFVDNLTNAAPILAEFEFPATVFMVAGRAGTYLDGEPDPAKGRLMTWDELRALQGFGITIGSHTMTHPHLAELPLEQQALEIGESKRILGENLQKPILLFAYPYGSALDYGDDTMRLVEQAGYRCGCSNRYGAHDSNSNRYEARRIWIDSTDELAMFIAKVTGRLDGLSFIDSDPAIRLRRWINKRPDR